MWQSNKLANKYGITTEGWIGTVTRVSSKTVIEVQDEYGSEFGVDAECFDLYSGETPKETPRKFKVGDRVRVNEVGLRGWEVLEKEGVDLGTVIVYKNKDSIGIEFDKNFGGHECGCGKNGHCWWLTDREIELVKEEPKEEPTPTPVVNVNVTVNLYENACWYCRKGGLVDLYLAGAMGICPSCGRVCNNTLLTTPKFNNNKHKEVPKAKENKPLTTAELEALPDGTRVFVVNLDNGNEMLKHSMTCWRVKKGNQVKRKTGFFLIHENGDGFNAYLEMPEGAVDSGM